MAMVIQAYQFALDPNPRTQRSLASHAGAARFAYNWGLELVTTRLHQHAAGQDVQVPWTLPELRREWNRSKQQVAPWWAENSKEAYNSGLDALARALRNWSDSRNGHRKGPRVGFPRRKKKQRARVACRFTTGAIRVLPDRKHVQLPRIGVLKTHESTRKLARRLEHGTARRLARLHDRAANLRRDALHKLTTSLATEHGTVVVEQLNVVGMVRNHRLARAISDTGMAELRRLLAYKTQWYGATLVVADPFYASSKTCSGCGWVKAKLTLAERTFCCETCGLRVDRDLNAARNLAKLVQSVAQSGWETPNARGADQKPQPAGQVAVKREAGTERRSGQTGTVGPQGPTARNVACTDGR